ncbi:MAG: hypothetical protein LBD78_06320 [Spirochaetaceae bacterium]|nr:hypothetical protein [Spirochaetaceae bacterium]
MKRRICFAGLSILLIFLVVISCKSTPPVEEPPPPPPPAAAEPAPPARDPNLEPPGADALASLEAAKARAEAARTLAYDFDGPLYAAQDWEAAESQYVLAGEQEKVATLGDVNQSIALYTNAADAFDGVFQQTIPQYAQVREDTVVATRDAAIKAGIAEVSPERLKAADDRTAEALRLYEEEKDYYSAAMVVLQAIDMYRALKTGTEAYHTRLEIEERDFGRYDADNYALADTVGLKALDAYDSSDVSDALINAEEALFRYETVLSTAWERYAGERKDAAGAERKAALELKADVAVKGDFSTAQELYNQAETQFRASGYAEASELYSKAETQFIAVRGVAAEKRRLAEEAIKMAEEKAMVSDETARNAETILEGGAQ